MSEPNREIMEIGMAFGKRYWLASGDLGIHTPFIIGGSVETKISHTFPFILILLVSTL